MYGIIGNPLEHSQSPKYFQQKFKTLGIKELYLPFKLDSIEDFPQLLQIHPDLKGLNVTIPFKQQIIPYLDTVSPSAKRIGAVNCIKISKHKITGFNTDLPGFKHSLLNQIPPGYSSKALILGTGGASKAVAEALLELNISFDFVSRKPGLGHLTYEALSESVISAHRLIINATPVGMWPEINEAPKIPYSLLTPNHFLFDLIYNPKETLFLKLGAERGTGIKNGKEMLRLQAEASWEIWNNGE